MKPIIIAIFLMTSLFMPGLGFAQPTQAEHLKQAREHVDAAVAAGQKGDAKGAAQHAQVALEHVQMAQKIKNLADLQKAIKSLDETIAQGKAGNAAKATEHAKETIDYLDAANAALGG